MVADRFLPYFQADPVNFRLIIVFSLKNWVQCGKLRIRPKVDCSLRRLGIIIAREQQHSLRRCDLTTGAWRRAASVQKKMLSEEKATSVSIPCINAPPAGGPKMAAPGLGRGAARTTAHAAGRERRRRLRSNQSRSTPRAACWWGTRWRLLLRPRRKGASLSLSPSRSPAK
jgi:hypothetical protein